MEPFGFLPGAVSWHLGGRPRAAHFHASTRRCKPRLEGNTRAPIVAGVAQFENLQISRSLCLNLPSSAVQPSPAAEGARVDVWPCARFPPAAGATMSDGRDKWVVSSDGVGLAALPTAGGGAKPVPHLGSRRACVTCGVQTRAC